MALVDFDKLAKEYASVNVSDTFNFSAISEDEYKKTLEDAQNDASELTAEQYKEKLKKLEAMIVPFLHKLHSTGDKEYIYWPNRKPVIEKQIEEILKLTRE